MESALKCYYCRYAENHNYFGKNDGCMHWQMKCQQGIELAEGECKCECDKFAPVEPGERRCCDCKHYNAPGWFGTKMCVKAKWIPASDDSDCRLPIQFEPINS